DESSSLNFPRLLRTCNLCRKRKIKCDGNKPSCVNCTKYGAECHYRPMARSKRSRKSDKSRSATGNDDGGDNGNDDDDDDGLMPMSPVVNEGIYRKESKPSALRANVIPPHPIATTATSSASFYKPSSSVSQHPQQHQHQQQQQQQ
ncbi:hypothetical protein GQ42DRAFT_48737, partial [Ramicandelaber brevisporus]